MEIWEVKIIELVQERLDAEDGWRLIREMDDAYYWEGVKWALEEKPIEFCWHKKQREGYLAILNDERYDRWLSELPSLFDSGGAVVLPAVQREDYVGEW